MIEQRSATQFVVVPPLARRDAIARQKDRLIDYLGRMFPRFSFNITNLAPVSEDEKFIIFPIMNFATPDGDCYRCRPLDPWVKSSIEEALSAFAVASPRLLN